MGVVSSIVDTSPYAAVYGAVSGRLADQLADRPGAAAERVSACPEWTVGQLVDHLAGVCSGSVVSDRPAAGADMPAVLAWWADAARRGGPGIAERGHEAGRLVLDAFTHELDIRHALGLPGPEDDLAYETVFGTASSGFSWSLTRNALPGLLLDTPETGPRQAGPGEPGATVRASRHDLMRSLTGRRTPAQIAALDWSVDPERWLPAFRWGPFSPPDRPAE